MIHWITCSVSGHANVVMLRWENVLCKLYSMMYMGFFFFFLINFTNVSYSDIVLSTTHIPFLVQLMCNWIVWIMYHWFHINIIDIDAIGIFFFKVLKVFFQISNLSLKRIFENFNGMTMTYLKSLVVWQWNICREDHLVVIDFLSNFFLRIQCLYVHLYIVIILIVYS